ncbi:MAG: hypothetical protein HYU36_02990 [Planctomycetes bacterium]|nr:hypothetical protein [Planctomycetota bacterium]
MATLTRVQMKQVVQQWKRAGPELERIRREALERLEYDWESVDDLLDMADKFSRPRSTTGMVEMQKWFMKARRGRGVRTE